jgi:uncharacterized membrane protein
MVHAEINRYQLAQSVAEDWEMRKGNYLQLINFIVDIDEEVCDLQFTIALRDRLNLIIETENE